MNNNKIIISNIYPVDGNLNKSLVKFKIKNF